MALTLVHEVSYNTHLGQEKILSTIWMPHELEIVHSFAVTFKKMCSQCVLTNTFIGGFSHWPLAWVQFIQERTGTKKDVFLSPKYNKGGKKGQKAHFLTTVSKSNEFICTFLFLLCFSFTPNCLNCTCAYVIHQWNSLWSPTICAFFFLHCIKP